MIGRIVFKKAVQQTMVLLIIITINFFLVHFMPGDPVIHLVGEEEYYYLLNNYPQEIEEIRTKYGLDFSYGEQYKRYLANTVRLDFGYSYTQKRPVIDIISFSLKWTLILMVPAILISAVLAAFLGLKAGWNAGKKFDYIITPLVLLLRTVPTYCLSIIILIILSFKLGLFPVGGMASGGFSGWKLFFDTIWHLVLPMSVLIASLTSYDYLIMRSAVLEVKKEGYVLTAISKGLSARKVLRRHVLKNALLPYITVVCMQFGHAFAGTMMIEVVFSWKGMGTLFYSAVNTNDFPLLQFSLLVMSACVLFSNSIADILYALIDPRVKEGSPTV